MDSASASRTALIVAAYRGQASAREMPICNDPWALSLAGADGISLAAEMLRKNPHLELYIAVRTAFLDGEVRRLVAGGAKQVVVLGAGLDTRAARLAGTGARFFEVDHPATQATKIARLRTLSGYPVEAATYVACDFERDDFLERLLSAGLDTSVPSAVLWEGVTYYLSESAVRGTLRRVATGLPPLSTIVFDYVGKRMASAAEVDVESQAARAMISEMGEPFVWGTNDVLPLLFEEGFRHAVLTTFDEACLNLTGTYARERKFRFQYLGSASVQGPSPWPG
jgi:methyltransferase (TIGR00027 family)